MRMRRTLVGSGLLALAACSNPFPFGPGRVDIKLVDAVVRMVSHERLFPGSHRESADPPTRQTLVLNISSERELLSYFRNADREIQVRCVVEGAAGNRSYTGFAIGPVAASGAQSAAVSLANPSGHRYTIYSFIDLEADDAVYKNGKPATQLDLRTANFAALRCHLLGVTKAPVLFPRSNDVVVPVETFRKLLPGPAHVRPHNSPKPTPLRGLA